MPRGKVQLRRIQNPVHRQVTFCKRRAGLLKKAKELSVLCDADIGIIIYSAQGKLFELATNGAMQDLIQRYTGTRGEFQVEGGEASQPQEMQHEISMLKDEIDFLQKGLRYMFGQGTVGHMTLDELQTLERHLEIWMYHIRSTKMHIMFQEIQSLKNKEGILKTANEILQEKIIKQNGFFDEGSTTGDIGYGYPLTIQNGIFNF
ncbi:uncharacterized protein A4U43_C02F5570 [Asparagus officinalis]|uniref:Uncharacterized protein n=1 Tax=Asparagus officinalis TaxID=4686 RepID=A0A5P1FG39_ASPOF|nr:MADS-box transcription factor 26-like isoform X2 [Asparagus officinalis]ONK77345.1 uncharacterized protein A4U43_C02F5570 [Asparagus officinalis]